jgi:hypothetical protein
MAILNKAQPKLAEDIAETEETEEVILSYKEETWTATTDA